MRCASPGFSAGSRRSGTAKPTRTRPMLRIEYIYWLVGAFLLAAAAMDLRARRWSAAAFWAVVAVPFLVGDTILAAVHDGVRWPAQAMGAGLIALGVLAARGHLRTSEDDAAGAAKRVASAARLGNRLFVPALAIPLVTVALVLGAGYARWHSTPLIDPLQTTLVALGIACIVAPAIGLFIMRAPFAQGL